MLGLIWCLIQRYHLLTVSLLDQNVGVCRKFSLVHSPETRTLASPPDTPPLVNSTPSPDLPLSPS